MAPSFLTIAVLYTLVINVLVSGTCIDVFQKIDNSLRVLEDAKGIQFSVPYNQSDKWSISVTKLNSIASTQQNRDYVLKKFELRLDNITDTLSLYIKDPLDLEEFNRYLRMVISSISLELQCGDYDRKTILVIVIPVIEFPPEFTEKPYSISISENTPIGTSIFNVDAKVQQTDVGGPRQFFYHIDRYSVDMNVDGFQYFDLAIATNGIIKVNKLIDFDALRDAGKPTYLMIKLLAEGLSGLQSTTTLNITITDEDDQGPAFSVCAPPPCRDTYRAYTQTAYRGTMNVQPLPIHAFDPDSFNNSIIYTLEPVAYNRRNTFSINRLTGQISQDGDVYITGVLTIKATENSAKGLSDFVTVLVSLGNDTTAPPQVGQAVVNDDSSNLKLALIILGVLALVIIIGILVVFFVYHKKVAKAVRPSDDYTDTPISHSQNWQGSKAELLAGDMLNPAVTANVEGRGNTLPPLTKDSATETGRKRSRRRNKNKEPEIFDGTREYDGKLDLEFFNDANTKSKIKQSTRSKDTKTDPKYWITIPNDDVE